MQKIDEILEFLRRKETNIQNISKETGISADKLYSWRNKRGAPKLEDSEILIKWYNKSEKSTNGFEEIQTDAQPTVNSQAVPMEAILKLIDANQKLADSHKNTSEANLRLTRMLEQRQATAPAPEESYEVLFSMISNLQEVVLELSEGKKMGNRNEVAALLYRTGSGEPWRADVGDTQKG